MRSGFVLHWGVVRFWYLKHRSVKERTLRGGGTPTFPFHLLVGQFGLTYLTRILTPLLD